MFNRPLFLIPLIVLSVINFAKAHGWVPNDSVPNTHANQPITTPNLGNPLYSNVPSASAGGTRFGTTYSNEAFAQMEAAKKAAKKQEDAAKRKWCKENNYPTSVSFCSGYKIEEEVRRKFCQEYPGKIERAVDQCKSDGEGYTIHFIASNCSNGTWSFGYTNNETGVSVGYTSAVSAGFCRADADRVLEKWKSDCDRSGARYQGAIETNCSDL